MDILCRLGFIAAELLMDGMSADDAAAGTFSFYGSNGAASVSISARAVLLGALD